MLPTVVMYQVIHPSMDEDYELDHSMTLWQDDNMMMTLQYPCLSSYLLSMKGNSPTTEDYITTYNILLKDDPNPNPNPNNPSSVTLSSPNPKCKLTQRVPGSPRWPDHRRPWLPSFYHFIILFFSFRFSLPSHCSLFFPFLSILSGPRYLPFFFFFLFSLFSFLLTLTEYLTTHDDSLRFLSLVDVGPPIYIFFDSIWA
jgi:hypothetical protein